MTSGSLVQDARWRVPLGLGLTLLIVLGQVQVIEPHPTAWSLALQAGLIAAILVGWWGNTWRPSLAWTAILLAASMALEAVRIGPAAIAGVVIGLIQVGSRVRPPAGIAVTAGVLLGFEVAGHQQTVTPLEVAFNALSFGAAYVGAYGFRLLRDEQVRAQTALDELRLSRQAQLESAKVEERARLAREIHDVLAHTLSALSVQLEGARLLMEQRPGDPEARRALERAQHLARDGLEEARRAVGTLRGDAVPGPDALPRLAAEFERDAGVPCRVVVEGKPVPLSSEARLALYRTAQEALTNVHKHARATGVTVHLRWGPGGAELTVEDEGEPKAAPVESGYGLTGIRERAELLGGRLEAGPFEGGYRVRLWVPA